MPDTQKQVNWARAVLSGKLKNATVGEREFAQEVVSGMHGRSMSELPKMASYPQLSRKPKRGKFINYGRSL